LSIFILHFFYIDIGKPVSTIKLQIVEFSFVFLISEGIRQAHTQVYTESR